MDAGGALSACGVLVAGHAYRLYVVYRPGPDEEVRTRAS